MRHSYSHLYDFFLTYYCCCFIVRNALAVAEIVNVGLGKSVKFIHVVIFEQEGFLSKCPSPSKHIKRVIKGRRQASAARGLESRHSPDLWGWLKLVRSAHPRIRVQLKTSRTQNPQTCSKSNFYGSLASGVPSSEVLIFDNCTGTASCPCRALMAVARPLWSPCEALPRHL